MADTPNPPQLTPQQTFDAQQMDMQAMQTDSAPAASNAGGEQDIKVTADAASPAGQAGSADAGQVGVTALAAGGQRINDAGESDRVIQSVVNVNQTNTTDQNIVGQGSTSLNINSNLATPVVNASGVGIAAAGAAEAEVGNAGASAAAPVTVAVGNTVAAKGAATPAAEPAKTSAAGTQAAQNATVHEGDIPVTPTVQPEASPAPATPVTQTSATTTTNLIVATIPKVVSEITTAPVPAVVYKNTGVITETNAVQTATGLLKSTGAFTELLSTAGNNSYGHFTMNTAGTWSYTMDNAHNEFVGGQTYTDSVTVQAADGTTQVITVTITGTNDGATISGTYTAALTETNSALSTSGVLTVQDADTAQNVFTPQTGVAGSNGYGTFAIDATGNWTYTATAHNEFVGGQTYTDSFTVSSVDTTATQVITVTITGTNDAPSISSAITASAIEGRSSVTVNALANASDIDTASPLSANILSLPAGVTYDAANHSFTFDPTNTAYAHLTPGTTTNVTVNYGVSDGTNATPQTATFTVHASATLRLSNVANPFNVANPLGIEDESSVTYTVSTGGTNVTSNVIVYATVDGQSYSTTILKDTSSATFNVPTIEGHYGLRTGEITGHTGDGGYESGLLDFSSAQSNYTVIDDSAYESATITLASVDGVSGSSTSSDEENVVYHLSADASRHLVVAYTLGTNPTLHYQEIVNGSGDITIVIDEGHGLPTPTVTIANVYNYDGSNTLNFTGESLESFVVNGNGVDTTHNTLPTFTILDDSALEPVAISVPMLDGFAPDEGSLVYDLNVADVTRHLTVAYTLGTDPTLHYTEINNGIGTIAIPMNEGHGQLSPLVTITDVYAYSNTALYHVGSSVEGFTVTLIDVTGNFPDTTVLDGKLGQYTIEDDSALEPATVTLVSVDGVSSSVIGGNTTTDEGNVVYHLTSDPTRHLTVAYTLGSDPTIQHAEIIGGTGTISIAIDEGHGNPTPTITIIDVSNYDEGASLESYVVNGSGVVANVLPYFTVIDDSAIEAATISLASVDGASGTTTTTDDGAVVYHLSADTARHLVVGYTLDSDPTVHYQEIVNSTGQISILVNEGHDNPTPAVAITGVYNYSSSAIYNVGSALEAYSLSVNGTIVPNNTLPIYTILNDAATEPATITLVSVDGVSNNATTDDEGTLVYHLSANTIRHLSVAYTLSNDPNTRYEEIINGAGTISVVVGEDHGGQSQTVTITNVYAYDAVNPTASPLEEYLVNGAGVVNNGLPTYTILDDSSIEAIDFNITATDGLLPGLLPGSFVAVDEGNLVYHLSTGNARSCVVEYVVSGDGNTYYEEIINGVGAITIPTIDEGHGQQTPTVTITNVYNYDNTAFLNAGNNLESFTVNGINPSNGTLDLPTYTIQDDQLFESTGGNTILATSGKDTFVYAELLQTPDSIQNFSVTDGDHLDLSHLLTNAANVQSVISINQQNGLADSSSNISINIGGQSYQMAALTGVELGVPDVLANPQSGQGTLSSVLNGAAWTDIIDITSSNGGPSSVSADGVTGGVLTNSYTNQSGDWTVQIKSGTATVDSTNHQITFTTDHASNAVEITTHDGIVHDISNVDKINWHG